MSKLKVSALQGLSASSDAITLANDGTCTANITNNLSNRNLIINGAMQVAQRGTAATTDEQYATVDRFKYDKSGTNETPTQAQVDVASGTTPYTLGFRKAYQITNGNQTGGAGAADHVRIMHTIEAQDIANSGWNYTSASSYITLSFWVKSSVAQNFYGFLLSLDGTSYNYPFETGSLTADTWTKITKSIPGNSNLQFDNDNGGGLEVQFPIFYGTNKTGSVSLNAWGAFNTSARTPDQTSTWYTTNDATFEITGVQLEVGSHATDFEHRSYADELRKCQRYFERVTLNVSEIYFMCTNQFNSGSQIEKALKTTMRATPTVTLDAATFDIYAVQGSGSNASVSFTPVSYTNNNIRFQMGSTGASTSWFVYKAATGYADATAEL